MSTLFRSKMLFLAAGLVVVSHAAESRVAIAALTSPAAAQRSDSPSLVTAPDGKVWLSWLETDDKDEVSLRFSTLDPRTQRWTAARTIAHGSDWVTNVFDAPQLVVEKGGRITVAWSFAGSDGRREVDTPRAFLSQSTDDGATWTAPRLLTTESDQVEYVSLTPLATGGLLAAWIDGRARKSDADPVRLYARRIGDSQPDKLLDARVCDCCRSSFTALPDGGALLAYRGRTAGEVRDILTARFYEGRWEPARGGTDDGWKINGCPVNGPRVASAELCVSRVWFTAADNQPRVFAAQSADGGQHFSEAQRIDLGHGGGRVDTLVLRDGSQLIAWLESATSAAGAPAAGLYLRQLSSPGSATAPVLLAPIQNDAVGRVFPRIALVKDFGATPAQIAVAFTRPGGTPHLETLLVTLLRAPFSASLHE